MTNDRNFSERGTPQFSQLYGHEDMLKSPSPSNGGEGSGGFEPGPFAPTMPTSDPSPATGNQTPPPDIVSVTVPTGSFVQAEDDSFVVSEDDQGAQVGNLLDDNGNGTDTAPIGTEVFVTAVNGQPFQGTAAIATSQGGVITVDNDGNITVDPSGAYNFLGDGEQIVETFTYTLTGENTQIQPGIFEAVIDVQDITEETGWVLLGATPDDFFGVAVAAAGDVNQDGFADVIVGGYRGGTDYQGRAYIVFGGTQTDGALQVADGAFGLNGTSGFAFAGSQSEQLLGQAVGGGGDYNGDGIADFLIASPRFDTQGSNNAGSVDVLFGGQGIANVAISGFTIFGTGVNTYAGITTANAGDVNNDGIDDILVGAWPADPNGLFEAGEVYVVYGQDGGQGNVTVSDLDGQNGFMIEGVAAGDRAGTSIASAGDFNGDGIADIIVGASHADPGGEDKAGSAYVIFGGTGAPATLNLANADFRIDGADEGEYLGSSVSSAGDLNGDGIDDIAIGALNADNGSIDSAGAVYVVFGGQGISGVLSSGALNGTNGFAIRGIDPAGQAGVSVSSAGDVNADGIDDLLIGAHVEGADDQGAAYVVFGRQGGFGSEIDLSSLNGSNGFKIAGAPGQSYMGWSVAGVGDVNGDRVDDIAVTAFGVDDFAGATIIIYGRGIPLDGESTATVTVTFQGENDPVQGVDDAFTITEDGDRVDVEETFLANDIDPDVNDSLLITNVSGQDLTGTDITVLTELGATLTVFLDGTFVYTPLASFQSLDDGDMLLDSFTYQVSDGLSTTGDVTVQLTITGINDAPTTNAETFQADESNPNIDGASGNANVLDNDFDPESAGIFVSAVNGSAANVGAQVSLASGGAVEILSDGTLSYFGTDTIDTLAGGEQLIDTATYTVSDGTLETTETVTIIINGLNDDPFAIDDAFSIDSNAPDFPGGANVLDNDFDIDATDVLTVTEFDGAAFAGSRSFTSAQGALVTILDDGTLQYDPNAAFDGLLAGETATETFSYVMSDGTVTDTATVTVTINGQNDAPATQTDNFTLSEDSGDLVTFTSGTANVLDNDTDPKNDGLTVTQLNGVALVSGSATGTTSMGADIFIDSSGFVDYVVPASFQALASGESITDSFTYTVSDGSLTTTETVNVTINGLNDLPTANADSFSVDENAAGFSGGANVLDNDTDIDTSDLLTVTEFDGVAFTGSRTFTSAQGASVTILADGTFEYVPGSAFDFLDVGDTATESFTYVISDGTVTDTATVTVTINGENDAPTSLTDNFVLFEDDGDLFTFSSGTANVLDNDTDPENNGLTVTELEGVALVSGFATGTTSMGADIFIDSSGFVDYVIPASFQSLDDGESVTDSFTYTVSDGDLSTVETVNIIINGSNDGPTAADDQAAAFNFYPGPSIGKLDTGAFTFAQDGFFGGAVYGTFRGDDSNSNGVLELSELTEFEAAFSGGGGGDVGMFFLDLSGLNFFEYNLDGGLFGDEANEGIDWGTASAQYLSGAAFFGVPTGNSTVGMVTVGVDTDQTVNVTQLIEATNVLDNDTDPDTSDSLFVSAVEGQASNVGMTITLASGALIQFNSDGTYTYDANGAYDALTGGDIATETVTYTVSDGDVTSTAQLMITVIGVGDGPVAVADNFSATGSVSVSNNVVTNDLPDTSTVAGINGQSVGSGATITLESGGTVTINPDGSFSYTAPSSFTSLPTDYTVIDSFSYRLDDGSGDTGPMPVEQIEPYNDTTYEGQVFLYANEGYADFGYNVAGIGDINGDGIDDLAVTADRAFVGAYSEVGKVYVIFGRTDDPGIGVDLDALDGTDGFVITGATPFGRFGHSIDKAGDVNGDGIDDFIVGSGIVTDGGAGAETAYIIYGRDQDLGDTFSAVESASSLDGTNGFAITNENANATFAVAVAGAGDVDGDGFDDVIIGSAGDDGQGTSGVYGGPGRAYVILGTDQARAATSSVQAEISAATPRGFSIKGYNDGFSSLFGFQVSGVGDVNGDGFDDVIVASQLYSGYYTPTAFVVFGSADIDEVGEFDAAAVDGTDGFLIGSASTAYSLGASVSGAGDVNGDGIDDLIVGSPGENNNLGNNYAGGAFIIFGKDSTQGDDFAQRVDPYGLDGSDGFRVLGEDGFYSLGTGVSALGDVNGDGFDDVAVNTGYGGYYTGSRAYVIFGADSFAEEFHAFALNGVNGGIFELADGFPPRFAGVGDIDGDGFNDAAIGVPQGNASGYNYGYEGVVYLVFGGSDVGGDQATASVNIALTPNSSGAEFSVTGPSGSFTQVGNGTTGPFFGPDGSDGGINPKGNFSADGGFASLLEPGPESDVDPSVYFAIFNRLNPDPGPGPDPSPVSGDAAGGDAGSGFDGPYAGVPAGGEDIFVDFFGDDWSSGSFGPDRLLDDVDVIDVFEMPGGLPGEHLDPIIATTGDTQLFLDPSLLGVAIPAFDLPDVPGVEEAIAAGLTKFGTGDPQADEAYAGPDPFIDYLA